VGENAEIVIDRQIKGRGALQRAVRRHQKGSGEDDISGRICLWLATEQL
jgi:hypothetical protein